MDNKDTIVALLSQLEHVTEVVVDVIPADYADKMPEGSVTFRALHNILPAVPSNSTRAEIYLPPYAFENEQNNDAIVAQMRNVLRQIQEFGEPRPTFDDPPILPTTPAEEPTP